MKTLFISTYNEYIILGLYQNENLIDKIEQKSLMNHSELLIPLIKQILENNNLIPNDLNEIIVVNGPGSFTGVRLGITVAKTLGYTLNIPVKTISSIEAIGASIKAKDKIITIDDNKGKYIGKFINNELVELTYLKNENVAKYFKNNLIQDYKPTSLDLNAIYNYASNIKPSFVHNISALYVKELNLND